ncbi:MAG: hypothetical protein M3N11_02690, partial [Actinomycetota bacterium]|nr:hypothetical protein [Actinomycetota bacterium]
VARARRQEDWGRDLSGARPVEAFVADELRRDPSLHDVEDRTASFVDLDFSFRYRGMPVTLDVKEKRQRYSKGVQQLWPGLREPDLFIVDETVYRRVVWQGGGGYLLIHDVPGARWLVLGPWELTLGHRVRYGRWGDRGGARFLKGKLLVDLSSAPQRAAGFSTDLVKRAIEGARAWRDRVQPYPVPGAGLPEVGRSGG